MHLMTKEKPKAKKTPPPEPDKPKVRPRETGEVVLVSVEIRPELARLVEHHSKTQGPTKKFIFNRAIEMFLQSVGLWPPKPDGA